MAGSSTTSLNQNYSITETPNMDNNKTVEFPSTILSENYNDDDNISDLEKDMIDHRHELEERLKNLQIIMSQLKYQLEEEKHEWKKQLEVFDLTSQQNENSLSELETVCPNCSELTESPDEQKDLNETSVLDFEKDATSYQDALLKAHAEKTANLKQQITLNTYKRQLLEVENMCNLELTRIEQSAQCLQPLQIMASEWNLYDKHLNRNQVKIDREIAGPYSSDVIPNKVREMLHVEAKDNKISKEVNAVYTKMHYCTLKVPGLQASNLWHMDDGTHQINSSETSSIWYSSECLSSPNINGVSPF